MKKTNIKNNNISAYSKHKILVAMTKPKSAYSIYFTVEDPKDDWLVNIVRFKTKTGECVYEVMVINPDMEDHIKIYENDGFVKV